MYATRWSVRQAPAQHQRNQRMQLQVIPAERVTPSMSVMHFNLRTPALTPFLLPSKVPPILVSAFGNSSSVRDMAVEVNPYCTYLQSVQSNALRIV